MNSGELKVDVPLASMESDCEEMANTDSLTNTPSKNAASSAAASAGGHPTENKLKVPKKDPRLNFDGGDSLTGSLEDLVNSFDEKLTMCFQDYQEQVDKIAPVQVCGVLRFIAVSVRILTRRCCRTNFVLIQSRFKLTH